MSDKMSANKAYRREKIDKTFTTCLYIGKEQ